MADYEWTRDDRGVDTYSKDYPFDAGDKHNFEWVVKKFEELAKVFPDVAKEIDVECVVAMTCDPYSLGTFATLLDLDKEEKLLHRKYKRSN